MKITPARRLQGEINSPGDKSISHRAAIFAAMADGQTRVNNFATSADCASTVECLRSLGVEIEQGRTRLLVITVWERRAYELRMDTLDCGNSGTTMRLMSGVLAGQDFESVLAGDESLQKRPMKRIIDPLGMMGAENRANRESSPAAHSWQRTLCRQSNTSRRSLRLR